jgi:hypothetical protein
MHIVCDSARTDQPGRALTLGHGVKNYKRLFRREADLPALEGTLL